jgi:hypothetical protein
MPAPARTSPGTNTDSAASPATGRHDGSRRRWRRGRKAAAVVAALVMAAGATYVSIADPFTPTTPASTDNGSATGTAKVLRGDLSERTMQNGTLGFVGDYKIVNRSSGTLTHLPSVGDLISQGKIMYRVGGKPVIFLQGSEPVHRELSWGNKGSDVVQLNRSLVALGYASKDKLDPASDYFGWQTYYGLGRMQKAVGVDVTGDLPLGQALFLPPAQLRITSVEVILGSAAAPNQPLLGASSTDRQVTVNLTASQQSAVAVGDEVTITMPTGKPTPGVVSAVGKVATADAEGNATVEVLIKPVRPEETGSLDRAPVQVSIVSDTVKDVLSVPVTALVSLAGGGYAVEVVDASGARTLIPVKTGMFDDSAGRVEVSGDGLTDGQNVVVPAS